MAMTADDMLRLQKTFVNLDDYNKGVSELDERLKKVEKCTEANNLTLVEIKTQLRLVLGVLSAVGLAVLSLVIRQFWG
ncbi:MAG: hypothetical protein EOM14_11310 [Clostridia bacterium]|nr:hypothetical protein [Clostridia bacterium]